jgi:urease accessory protein
MKQNPFRWNVLIIALFVVSTPLLAHHLPTGIDGVAEFDQARMVSGMLHPFTGLDHLLLALSIGWLAYRAGAGRGRILAASFLGSLAVGMMGGRFGLGLPMPEHGIALSVVMAGLVLAYVARRLPYSEFLLAVLAGLWHGNAHGAEMPAAASFIGFGAALLAGTATAVLGGMGLAALCSCSRRAQPMERWIGAGVTIAGTCLWLS